MLEDALSGHLGTAGAFSASMIEKIENFRGGETGEEQASFDF